MHRDHDHTHAGARRKRDSAVTEGAKYARGSEQVISITAFACRREYLSSSGRNASDEAPKGAMSDASVSQAQSWGEVRCRPRPSSMVWQAALGGCQHGRVCFQRGKCCGYRFVMWIL